MKHALSKTIFVCLLILCLGACAPNESTEVGTDISEQSTPAVTQVQPTVIPDIQILIESATLLNVDFENEYLAELDYDPLLWHVEIEADENSIFCNRILDDWSSFLFGLDEWENYAITLRVKFLSANQDQGAEVYLRINQNIEGYRASIYNNEWADVSFYPPGSDLGGAPVSIRQNEWFQVELHFVGDTLKYFLNDELVVEASDDKRASGRAGYGAAPNTEVCVDDLVVWGLDETGSPVVSPANLVVEPFDGVIYTIDEKVENRPTIPVFYPWSGTGQDIDCGQTFYFDCDTGEHPYSLVWIAEGLARDLESTQPNVNDALSVHMLSDENTLYLISEEWHYWNPAWRTLATDSKFYLNEVFGYHVDSEYGHTLVINFEHPEWPGILAEKALNFKNSGFNGIMLDWWHNYAGNGRPPQRVEAARLAIAKAIREKVGDDFILMGNVNDNSNDPTAQYLSGVFMELWKPNPDKAYALTYVDQSNSTSLVSIEKMEDLLKYWDENLYPPKIIAFEPWKITTGDYVADRYTEENIAYAKLFTAMAMVIPENGYILYADNNDDWDGGDHQHAYYDYYLTDFGKPISGMIDIVEGVAYKQFERGIIAYNRTLSEVTVTLSNGKQFTIGPLEGLFLKGNY